MNEELRPPPEDKSWLQMETRIDPWAAVGATAIALCLLVIVAIFLFSNHN